MAESETRFRRACNASDNVVMVGKLWTDGTWWFISNSAGVVNGIGATSLEACEDLLGPVAVNP